MRVDIHAHVITADMLGQAGRYGPDLIVHDDGSATLRVGDHETHMAPSERFHPSELLQRLGDPALFVEAMDARGVDVVGVTASPLFYLYWAEPEVGVPFNRTLNDCMHRFTQHDPRRLFFIPTVPLQDMDATLEELDRALGDLGGRGVNIGSDNALRGLDDEYFWPFYDKVQSYDVPIFIHPYPAPLATGAKDPYHLSWIVGYTMQETEAFARLVLGGVLDDFPALKVCLTHGGGAVPYQFGRLAAAAVTHPDVRAKRPLEEYLKNFYFDILVHDPRARRYLVEFMGPDNVVVGDNWNGWDGVDGFKLLDELGLSSEDHHKIAGENAVRLFKLDGS
jgi:aminocarboxymuconate-semialdehyde decarboxylase